MFRDTDKRDVTFLGKECSEKSEMESPKQSKIARVEHFGSFTEREASSTDVVINGISGGVVNATVEKHFHGK